MDAEKEETTDLPEVTPSLEDGLEVADEIEEHFYRYCKIIVRNVIEPVLLTLCEQPRFEAQILPCIKTAASTESGCRDLTQCLSDIRERRSDLITCSVSVKDLVNELKGLKNDLKMVMKVQECLIIEKPELLGESYARDVSIEVISPLQEIQRTMAKMQSKSTRSQEEQFVFKQLLTDLKSSLQEIDGLFQKISNSKIKMIGSSHLQTVDPVDESPRVNLPPILDKNACQSKVDFKKIQLRATSSSYLDISCISSDGETSSDSEIEYVETSESSSCFIDKESNDDNVSDSDRLKFSLPETRTIQAAETLGDDREAGIVRIDVLGVKGMRSQLNTLKRVRSKYLDAAKAVLHNSVCGKSNDCKCTKPIVNLSQTEVEWMRFAHKNEIERAVKTLLAGILKDVDLTDIFWNKSKTSEQFLSAEQLEPNTKTAAAIEHPVRYNDVSRHKRPNLFLQKRSGSTDNASFNQISNNLKGDLSEDANDIESTQSTKTCGGIAFQDLESKEFLHILQIIKMLRSIVAPLKAEGVNIINKFYKVSCDEHFVNDNLAENRRNGSTHPATGAPETLMDLLLEDLFKTIFLIKYEQKMQEDSKIESDEYLHQLLFDLNESSDSTPTSFSEDAFEEFRSKTPSVAVNVPDERKDTKNACEEKILATFVKEEPKVSQHSDVTKKTDASVSGLGRFTKASELPSVKTEEAIIEIRSDRLCKERISDIFLSIKAKKSSRLKSLKDGGTNESNESCQKLSADKNESVEFSQSSTDRLSKKPPQEIKHIQGTESEESKQLKILEQSGATNHKEKKVDLSVSLKSLGQQLIDIEKYLTDFDSEERLRFIATEVEKFIGESNVCDFENQGEKEEAFVDYRLNATDASEQTLKVDSNNSVLSQEKLPRILRLSNASEFTVKSSIQTLHNNSVSNPIDSSSSGKNTSFESEEYDYNSFTTADNFVPSVDLPVSDVFYAKLSPERSITHLKLHATRLENKFRFADGTPKISKSKSAEHLVFSKHSLNTLIQEEANALAIDVPTILQALQASSSINFKPTSQTSDIDVEYTKSEVKLFAIKSKLPIVSSNGSKTRDSNSDMLIHKPALKSSRIKSGILSSVQKETEMKFSQDVIERNNILKSLQSIVSKIKVKKSETESVERNPMEPVNNSGNDLKPLNSKKPDVQEECASEELARQDNRDVLKNVNTISGFKKPDRPACEDKESISTESATETIAQKPLSQSLSKFSLENDVEGDKDSVSIREQSATEKYKEDSSNSIAYIDSSAIQNYKAKNPTRSLNPPLHDFKNVLSTSSLSNFSESSQYSRTSSESSISQQLISASGSSLFIDETTTSVLALEPVKVNAENSSSAVKPAKKSLPLNAAADIPVKREVLVSRERLIKSTFDLIDSCEKILNCKRKSDELHSHSFNPDGNSLVTVLKKVDERFADKMSSCGPASLCKNIASQTSDTDAVLKDESSEVEERNTQYDQPESREASKQGVNLPTESSLPWFGSLRPISAPVKNKEDFGKAQNLQISETSYYSTSSEVFYDLPTVESDLSYHLEIERNFNLSCAEIEQNSNTSCARISPVSVENHGPTCSVVRGELEDYPICCCSKHDSLQRKKKTDGKLMMAEKPQEETVGGRPQNASGHERTAPFCRHKRDEATRNQDKGYEKCDSQSDPKMEKVSVKKCDTYVKEDSSDKCESALCQNYAKHDSKPKKESTDCVVGRKKDLLQKDWYASTHRNVSSYKHSILKLEEVCKRENCKIHGKIKRNNDGAKKAENHAKLEPAQKHEASRRIASNKKPDSARMNSESKAAETGIEEQLTMLSDSLKMGTKMHCFCHQKPTNTKYSLKAEKSRTPPLCFRPLCAKNHRRDDAIRRSLFTGHSRNRAEDDFFSVDSSAESEISRPTFKSDGENFVTVNAGFVMEFFERVYGVYDHIRQCQSCKALMSQIIEEVITDLSAMRGKT